MWYKNAIIYLLPDGWQLEAGFAEKLEQAAFTPCMGLEPNSTSKSTNWKNYDTTIRQH